MKRTLSILLPLAVLLWFCGCNTPPKTVAFRTLEGTAKAVDMALQVYASAYVDGKVTADQDRQVREAKAKYELAMNAALDLWARDWTQLTPAKVAALADELTILIYKLASKGTP
jgi:hypothetical protein